MPASGASQPSSTPAHPSSPSSGGTAGFKVRGGDNSIPNYGEEASGAQNKEARMALNEFLEARVKGEWSQACELLASGLAQRLVSFASNAGKAATCSELLKQLSTAGGEKPIPPVSGRLAALRVSEKTAFALFYGPNGEKYAMPMLVEGGKWKVNQFAPLPYPPGGSAPGG